MSQDKTISANLAETGEGTYTADIEVSGHKLKIDEPLSLNGKNLGPTPYDYLVSALIGCTAITVRWFANNKNWPLEKVEVKITHSKEKIEGRFGKVDVFNKEVILYGDQLTEDQRKKLIEISAKCPVQKTLEGNSVIYTKE